MIKKQASVKKFAFSENILLANIRLTRGGE